MSIVITPATAAATYPANGTDPFMIPKDQVWQFSGYGFSGGDAINLQVITADGTFANYVDPATATAVTLSSAGNSLQVQGPFIGRWSKGVTTGSVGLRMFSGKQDY